MKKNIIAGCLFSLSALAAIPPGNDAATAGSRQNSVFKWPGDV